LPSISFLRPPTHRFGDLHLTTYTVM